MKSNPIFNKIYTTTIFFIHLIGIISCSTREEFSHINNKEATLKFKVAGILENSEATALQKIAEQQKIVNLSNDFDALINISEKHKRLSLIPIDPGIKYRILIYDASNNNLIKNIEAIAGIPSQITVDAGKAYKWYAISVNDTNTVPSVNENLISGSDIINKDVLYTSSNGIMYPEYGSNNLEITFKHNTIQYTIQLDTRGLFGKINNTSAIEMGINQGGNFTSIAQIGDLNLLTGEYSNLQTLPAITAANMENTSDAQGDFGATKTAKFYTINKSVISANNLVVKLNKLDITLDDNTIRNFTPNSTIPYPNTEIIPSYGNKYTITARMIESPVKVSGGLWARSNLYYADNITHSDKYRFHPNNEYTIASVVNLSINGVISLQLNGQAFKVTNEYWNWMSETPTGLSNNIDPCSKVYPTGIWRMPTNAEYLALNNNPTLGFDANTPLLLGGARLSSTWELDAGQQPNTVYPTNSRKLFISFLGRRTSDGSQIVNSPGSLASALLASGEAHYWTSTKNGSSVFYHNRIYNSFIGTLVGPDPPTMVPGNTIQGRNIRCIRK